MSDSDVRPAQPVVNSSRVWFGTFLAVLLAGLVGLGLGDSLPSLAGDTPQTVGDKQPTIGGIPLFASWPQDQKPDSVIVLSGETYGFYQPCGCTRPQKGGLERRAQFIQTLKAKGWRVAGVDLGDVYPDNAILQEQGLLKYKLMMNALREMGYLAVGVGKTEFKVQLDKVLGKYALQKQQPPFTLGGNVLGLAGGTVQPRAARFQDPGGSRPLIDESEFATVGTVPVSVSAVVGKALQQAVAMGNFDPSITFEANTKQYLGTLVQKLAAHASKPELNILLYQGLPADAVRLAGDFPDFQVILCQAEDSEPPQYPQTVTDPKSGRKTLVIQVGHKGRYVGVVGAFKRAGGGVDLKYQLVPLGEEYITPGTEAQAHQTNSVLNLLEGYSKQVKDWNLIDEFPRAVHPAQAAEPKLGLHFIGSNKCQPCHVAEFNTWNKTAHGNAFNALVTAKRPSLRQFDGECIVCHTVGFGYKTGYESQAKTPALLNVGCESCHGPGSAHAADPRNAKLLSLQMPWAQKPGDRLDMALIAQLAPLNGIQRGQVAVPPAKQQLFNKVSETCMHCHNHENDPNFDLFTNWPKIVHGTPGKVAPNAAAGK